jgi:hypothetical protein
MKFAWNGVLVLARGFRRREREQADRREQKRK